VCARRATLGQAERLGIVRRNDPRADGDRFKTFKHLCVTAGLFKVGTTNFEEEGDTMSNLAGYNAPPIEEYGSLGITGTLKAYIPGKAEVINMLGGGAGAVSAFLLADQLIPRLPWIGDKLSNPTYGVWVGVGTKLVMAFLAGKLVSKANKYIGAGMGVGFIASGMYDILDAFVFKGAAPGGAGVPASIAPPIVDAPANGLGNFITGRRSSSVADRMFAGFSDAQSDVEILQPDDAALLGIEVLDQDDSGPMYGLDDDMSVGSFLS
jgi:hypothetical protein